MEAAKSSETLVSYHITTWLLNPDLKCHRNYYIYYLRKGKVVSELK